MSVACTITTRHPDRPFPGEGPWVLAALPPAGSFIEDTEGFLWEVIKVVQHLDYQYREDAASSDVPPYGHRCRVVITVASQRCR